MVRAIAIFELGEARTLHGARRVAVVPEQGLRSVGHRLPVETTFSLVDGHLANARFVAHFHDADHQILDWAKHYVGLQIAVHRVRNVVRRVQMHGDILVGSERQMAGSQYAVGDQAHSVFGSGIIWFSIFDNYFKTVFKK